MLMRISRVPQAALSKRNLINKFVQRSCDRLSHLEISNNFPLTIASSKEEFHRLVVDFNKFRSFAFAMFK